MNSLKTTFAKKDIQNKFNISLATVNNWIKTGVIPSPKNGYYTKDTYLTLVNSIETNAHRLQSRANRSYQNFSDIVFLGIKDKKRKELLVNLIEEFENSNLSIMESLACLGKQILINNDLYNENSAIYTKINRIYTGKIFSKNFILKIKMMIF